jgi:hypothetical protein
MAHVLSQQVSRIFRLVATCTTVWYNVQGVVLYAKDLLQSVADFLFLSCLCVRLRLRICFAVVLPLRFT